MVCKNCLKFDNDLFEYKFNVFKDRHSLVLFFVKFCFKHTHTKKKKKWEENCSCNGEEICWVCQEIFRYVCGNLYKLAALNSHFVCEIINEKYQYQHQDWFSGR